MPFLGFSITNENLKYHLVLFIRVMFSSWICVDIRENFICTQKKKSTIRNAYYDIADDTVEGNSYIKII
jgi:hypothetical protein